MKLIPKLQTGWQPINQQVIKEWSDNWKSRTTKSRVLQGRGVESDKQYTERRKRETAPQRTWLSNAADVAHGVGVGASAAGLVSGLALAPAATVGSLVLGTAGSKVTDKVISKLSNGKYPTWAKFLSNKTGISENLSEMTNPGMWLGGARGYKWGNNVEKRGIETFMRTTPLFNPIPEAKNNIITMWNGQNGGKQRLAHIGNYILTGTKTGPKGYYNSFAGYVDLNTSNILKNVPLKQRVKDFIYPKGESFAYSGFLNSVGHPPKMTERNDIIDAFLYNKIIDPSFGLQRVSKGKDFGIHTNYIKSKYVNKETNIPVYEFESKHSIPENKVSIFSPWEGREKEGLFTSGNGEYLNVGGHLAQEGFTTDGLSIIRKQDIWKFNPKEYSDRWFIYRSYQDQNPLIKGITKWGLQRVNSQGTPIITRTKWEPN